MIKRSHLSIIISVIILLQLVLISHRVSFDLNILINFYKPNVAIKKSVKDQRVFKLSRFIIDSNLKDFNFSNFQDTEEDESIKERLISYIYPIKYAETSKNIISLKEIKNQDCIERFTYSNIFLYEC